MYSGRLKYNGVKKELFPDLKFRQGCFGNKPENIVSRYVEVSADVVSASQTMVAAMSIRYVPLPTKPSIPSPVR